MISRLKLKFGTAPGKPVTAVDVTPITVFVGPNNSGKSKVLSEIKNLCERGQQSQNDVVLDAIEFSGIKPKMIEEALSLITLEPMPGEHVPPGHIVVGTRGQRNTVQRTTLLSVLERPTQHLGLFGSWFLRHLTLMLDGKSRISLVGQQGAGDLQGQPNNSLQVLFRDDAKRAEVRRIVFEAFGVYLVVDPTALGQLRFRLSGRPPKEILEERGIHPEAVRFHAEAELIDRASDGVKAFTGIITELIAGDPKIVLIDEPEAFLHPALAAKLGNELARAAVASDKRVFVSTHSPTFVMGCIQSGAPITIVRLTYRSTVPTARTLPSQEILELMRNPLLRSTGVLSGLFYEFVIVTESDADRAFYQEINERLLRFKPEWGIPNCLFLNAQNKQTVHTIMKPLRQLGIPTAGIVDIDVVKDGGQVWTSLLAGASVPQLSHQALGMLRSAVKAAMEATGRNMKREGGTAILPPTDKEAAENLLHQLGEYGIFVVPGGELESWLKTLGANGHGPAWLIEIFEQMGEDPETQDYVRPGVDDVWLFLSNIRTWMFNPNRKGIPA